MHIGLYANGPVPLYAVRRKLKIGVVTDMSVFSMFSPDLRHRRRSADAGPQTTSSPLIGSTFCDGGSRESSLSPVTAMCFPDPRVDLLGYRLIRSADQPPPLHLHNHEVEQVTLDQYHVHRHCTGVAEGAAEIPPTKCFPLEYNCDYLHGVSFHKGCYIGQELTARTHHTGVIRKRILPIRFDSLPTTTVDYDTPILNQAGRSVGKIRQTQGRSGLALIRLKEAFAAESLSCNSVPVTVWRPVWWPQEKAADNLQN